MAPRNPLAKITETVAAVRKDPKDAAARLAGQARVAVSHGAAAATRAAGTVSGKATTALASRWGRKSSRPAPTVASAPPVAKQQSSGLLAQEPESPTTGAETPMSSPGATTKEAAPTETATKEGAASPEDVPTPAKVAKRVSKKAPAKKSSTKKSSATKTSAPRSAAKSTPSAKLPPRKPVDETDGEPDKG